MVGAVGSDAQLLLPFRGQKAPQWPDEEVLQAVPEGLPRLVAMRSYMTAGTTSVSPSSHAGLGLDAYVQVREIERVGRR